MKLATHGFYYPRNAGFAGLNLDVVKSNAIYVMWTRTNLLPIKPWHPNHFVLLKNKNQFTPVKSYSAAVATYKKHACSSSPLPETRDSPLFKSKWKRKKWSVTKKSNRIHVPLPQPTQRPHLHQRVPRILAVPRAQHPANRPTKAR